jgi:hypothetical protein
LPIAGAVLTVIGGDGGQAGRGQAGATGGYEITGVPLSTFSVVVMAPGYTPQAAVVRSADGGVVGHDFMLAGSGGLSGTVLAVGGAPVPEATVFLTDATGDVLAQDITDLDGRFVLPGTFRGTYLVTATATGYQPASTPVDLEGTAATALLALVAEAGVHGVVRGASDAPVPGATVSLANAGGDIVASAVTGPDGAYQLTGLDGGDHMLAADGDHVLAAGGDHVLAAGGDPVLAAGGDVLAAGGDDVLAVGGYQPVSAVVLVEDGQTANLTVQPGPS